MKRQEKSIRTDISWLLCGASEHSKEETIRKGSWTTEAQQVPLSHDQGLPIQEYLWWHIPAIPELKRLRQGRRVASSRSACCKRVFQK